MPAYSTVKRILLSTEDLTRRKVLFLALLTSALPKAAPGPVLVGGSAIEVYLDGMLRTGDMDIVYSTNALKKVLKSWRFELGGGLRAWVNDELGLAVDMVGGELSGSQDRLTKITTDYGPANVIGIEDLILKRLSSAKHWGVPTDMEQAYLMARAYRDTIDWVYIKGQASMNDTSDVLQGLTEMLSTGNRRKHGFRKGRHTTSSRT